MPSSGGATTVSARKSYPCVWCRLVASAIGSSPPPRSRTSRDSGASVPVGLGAGASLLVVPFSRGEGRGMPRAGFEDIVGTGNALAAEPALSPLGRIFGGVVARRCIDMESISRGCRRRSTDALSCKVRYSRYGIGTEHNTAPAAGNKCCATVQLRAQVRSMSITAPDMEETERRAADRRCRTSLQLFAMQLAPNNQ